jgi:hypothetical protein
MHALTSILFQKHAVVTAACILAIIHLLWIGYLFLFHLYGILFSWTTNEMVLAGRYKNQSVPGTIHQDHHHHSIYSRGCLHNICDFFHVRATAFRGPHAYVNWHTFHIYDIATLHEKTKSYDAKAFAASPPMLSSSSYGSHGQDPYHDRIKDA